MSQTQTPDPAVLCALAEVQRLEGQYRDAVLRADQLETRIQIAQQVKDALAEDNRQLRAENARLRAWNEAQHRCSETATANYLALTEERDLLREACELAIPEIRCLYQQLTKRSADRMRPEDASVKTALDALSAALAAATPEEVRG